MSKPTWYQELTDEERRLEELKQRDVLEQTKPLFGHRAKEFHE